MKNRKMWLGSTIVLTLVTIGAAFISPFDFIGNLFKVRAATYSNSTITFNTSGMQRSGTTTTITAHTQTGGTIICKIFDNDSTTLNNYNNIIGAPKLGSFIRFYESDGVTEYTFEDLQMIGFQYDSYFGFYIHTVNANGTTTKYGNPYGTNTSSSTRTIDFTNYPDVSQIAVEATNTFDYITRLKSIIITYNCTTKYQTGVSINTTPTKTEYTEGEYFDSTGMIVKADYSNNTSVATKSYSIYPSGPLSTSDSYVTISFNGFSTTQSITVNSRSEATIEGTYNYNSSGTVYSTLILNEDGTGTYYRYPATYYLTWTYSSATGLTLTKTSVSGEEPAYGQIFYDSDVIVISDSDMTFTDGELQSVKIYVKGVSTAKRTFSK